MNNEFGQMIVNPSTIEDLANEFTDEYTVINEIIANAYDAKAMNFKIILNKDKNQIIFIDNGIGMNQTTAKKGFLEISNNKRNNEEYKNSSRIIMGRKGSGRIGLFGIAKKIYVYSKKIEEEPIAFLLNVTNILNNISFIGKVSYDNEYMTNYDSGTKIIIEDFFSDNIFRNLEELKYVIYENFFPIISLTSENLDNLKMYIELIKIENGKLIQEIIEPKSDIFKSLDRFMNIKDFENKENIVKEAKLSRDKSSSYGYDPNTEAFKNERIIDLGKTELSVSKECNVKTKYNDFEKWNIKISKGWIGTLATISDSENDKNYCVKVYSRNRLVIQDIRKDFKIDKFYLNYLVGDIFVDDLDNDELKDITKISRNAYGNQDERYQTVVDLVKKMAQKLIVEKSKIAKKNKNLSDTKNTQTMKDFLVSTKETFSFDDEKFDKFKTAAVRQFRVKVKNDKKIIFISHKSIHEKSNQCLNYKEKDSLCYNSFLTGLILTIIFEKIKQVKQKTLNNDTFKIIFTSLDKYSMKLGKNIHYWLREEGFNRDYYENTIFYACISCKYIKNWNTDIEYGASWFTREQGTFCIVDPYIDFIELPSPINSEIFKELIIDFSDLEKSINHIILDYEGFKKIFIEPLELIGIKVSKQEYNYLKEKRVDILEEILNSFSKKRLEVEAKIKIRNINKSQKSETAIIE